MIPFLVWTLILSLFVPVPATLMLAVNVAKVPLVGMLHQIVMDGELGRDTIMRMRPRNGWG